MLKLNGKKLSKLLLDNQIALTPDFESHLLGINYLANIDYVVVPRTIKMESPCALYGGVYGPSTWSGTASGLCSIGAFSYSHSPVPESLSIGRYCSIAKGLKILEFSHPTEYVSSSVAFFKPHYAKKLTTIHHLIDAEFDKSAATRTIFNERLGKTYPVIEHDVWIGENVSLALGIKIGTGAVIAAGSTVTKDVPPYAVVGGVPATVRKYRFNEEVISRLLKSKWWEFNCISSSFGLTDPVEFLEYFENNKLEKLAPNTIDFDLLKGI